jgi:choline dehydrogenase
MRRACARPCGAGGEAPGLEARTDAEIEAFLRATAVGLWHPAGSARMGIDADAIVDEKLRVNGVEVQVADASVMPLVPSANTNAAVIMIAEKAADLILDHPSPPPAQTAEGLS